MSHMSVVIPVYKNESTLSQLFSSLKDSLQSVTDDYNIIMVEDSGGDRSWEIIKDLSKQNNKLKGIQLSRNFGQHYAITAGLDHCDSDWVVVMDADMQDSPGEIPRLYEKARQGYDVVLAKRKKRKDNIVKRAVSYLYFKIFNYFTGLDYDNQAGNFQIISRRTVNNLRDMRENPRFVGGLVSWTGLPTAYIETEHNKRHSGKSSYTLKKLFKLASDMIIAHSDKPLRFAVKLGFVMSLSATLMAGYIIVRYMIYGSPVMGWSSIFASLYLIGGVIIALLGIIGIYIGKIFDETKKRPLYIIKEHTDNG